jgi:benzylsuccinate CoA-transferase BbsF subunit
MSPDTTGGSDRSPLSGYRVADFTWMMAGPICTTILADLGAEVIKIESRRHLDALRKGRPISGDRIEAGDAGHEPDLIPMFHSVNRNKLSLTLDLRHPDAGEIVRRLIATCDVVAENFAPGIMARLGLDYPEVRQLRPDVVMVALSAAGQTGPLKELRGYATTIAALSGHQSLVGYPGEDVMGIMGLNFSDPTCGMFAAVAVLAALAHRRATGEGQYIDLSQVEALTTLLGEPVFEFLWNRRDTTPIGNRHRALAPHGVYPCRGEDAWIALSVGSEREWAALCRAMGDPDWCRERRFADRFRRSRHASALDERLAAWTRQFAAEELTALLQAAGVAAAPVLNVEQQFRDPQLRARGFYVDVEHPLVGTEILYDVPFRLSETPGRVRRPAPNLGEHTESILGELIGLSRSEVEGLAREGVIV